MSATPLANPYLSGLYAPVESEQTVERLEVIGELPAELHGVYVRNSPNPRFPPQGRYHWFDGDGMVHGVLLRDGQASYRNRYVHTAAYEAEEQAGRALWRGIMEPIEERPDGPDKDTANTDLVWHRGQLLALWWLGGVPYRLDPRSLETQGPEDFGGTLSCGVASHPKVDPETGEMMFIDYSPYRAPYLTYGVVSAAGTLERAVPIEIPGPRLFHDIAITCDHTVLLDLPMFWHQDALAAGKRRVGFDPGMPARFGVIPRHGGADEVRWFEAPACYMYHTVNAWQDGDEIVLTGCKIDDPMPRQPVDDEPQVPRLAFLRLEPYLHRWRLNLSTGAVQEERLQDVLTEFPRIDARRLGRRNRYAYCPRLARQSTLSFDAELKVDLETGAVEAMEYGPGRVGDEAIFAPRHGGSDEDDGWVVTFVHDLGEGRDELVVWNAQDVSAGPVARVLLPARVPAGFHAHWVPGEEM